MLQIRIRHCSLRETVRKKNMTAYYTDSDAAKFFSSRNLATLRSTQGAKLLLARIRLPYLKNRNGIGARTRANPPSSVPAQLMPRFSKS